MPGEKESHRKLGVDCWESQADEAYFTYSTKGTVGRQAHTMHTRTAWARAQTGIQATGRHTGLHINIHRHLAKVKALDPKTLFTQNSQKATFCPKQCVTDYITVCF